MANANSNLVGQKPVLLTKEITDIYTRKNFENLKDYFSTENQLLGFKFFDQSFSGAQENIKIAHGFSFIPQDILVTKVTGAGIVQFNYGLFDQSTLDISVTDACRVRFFVGTYWMKPTTSTEDSSVIGQFSAMVGSSSGSSSSTQTSTNPPALSIYGGGVIGEIKTWANPIPFDGAVICDGTQYAAKDYPKAAAALWDTTNKKYAYGGSGVFPGGFFNVPDARGYFLRGWANNSSQDADKSSRTGSTGGNTGNNVGSIQGQAVGPHRHNVSYNANLGYSGGGGNPNTFWGTVDAANTRETNQTGLNIASETRPLNLYVNYIFIIK